MTAMSIALALGGCPSTQTGYAQPSGASTVDSVVARLTQGRAAVTSFRGASVMDYWLGSDRVKGSMLVMGAVGAKVRFNALSPAGESVMADLACNGTNFVLVDFQNNCVLTGPCSRDSIAQLLRISLEPDEFLQLALGSTPVLQGAAGNVLWDSTKGHEVVELSASTGTQSIVIDARDGRWDVLSSELRDRSGIVVWKVENTDFTNLKDAAGTAHRVPGKTRLTQPAQKADLLVEWEDRALNVALSADKFELVPPQGLPQCGAQKTSAR
jgi:outer membrane lipoprotein-sorting protein